MAGVDKLIVLCDSLTEPFDELAQTEGIRRWSYSHVVDLRESVLSMPAILYRCGIHNGRHKLEIVEVARVGRRRTFQIVRAVFGHLSRAWLYRIDFCVDLFGLSVWDLARFCYLGGAQNYEIYRTRKGETVYLQRSDSRTVQIYDRGKLVRASKSPWARMLRPGEDWTRLEVQLRGRGLPYRNLRQLDHYGEMDLLADLQFRRVISSTSHQKPIRSMAAAHLANEVHQFGLHAVLKRFPPAQRAYIQKIFTEDISSRVLPDIRRQLRHAIRDWLNDRIRFPRFPEPDGQE